MDLTIVRAALVGRRVGLGFSARGTGGGRATVCGAAASGERELAEGIDTLGGFDNGGISV